MAVHRPSRVAVPAVPEALPDDEEAEGLQAGVDVGQGERGTPVADPERERGVGDAVVK